MSKPNHIDTRRQKLPISSPSIPKFVSVPDRPDLYDWLYHDYLADIPMYCSLADQYDEVLECGIGTGRVAVPLALKDKVVYGIDKSAQMLKALDQKLDHYPHKVRDSIKVFEADMRDFDLGRKFPIIFCILGTFNYLLTLHDQQACLDALRKQTVKGGKLVLELLSYSLYPGWLHNDPSLKLFKHENDPTIGQSIEMWKLETFDSSTQIVKAMRYFKFYNSAGQMVKEEKIFWENRFFFLGEIQLLLQAAGFQIDDIYGDYQFGPYHHGSEFVVIVATAK